MNKTLLASLLKQKDIATRPALNHVYELYGKSYASNGYIMAEFAGLVGQPVTKSYPVPDVETIAGFTPKMQAYVDTLPTKNLLAITIPVDPAIQAVKLAMVHTDGLLTLHFKNGCMTVYSESHETGNVSTGVQCDYKHNAPVQYRLKIASLYTTLRIAKQEKQENLTFYFDLTTDDSFCHLETDTCKVTLNQFPSSQRVPAVVLGRNYEYNKLRKIKKSKPLPLRSVNIKDLPERGFHRFPVRKFSTPQPSFISPPAVYDSHMKVLKQRIDDLYPNYPAFTPPNVVSSPIEPELMALLDVAKYVYRPMEYTDDLIARILRCYKNNDFSELTGLDEVRKYNYLHKYFTDNYGSGSVKNL